MTHFPQPSKEQQAPTELKLIHNISHFPSSNSVFYLQSNNNTQQSRNTHGANLALHSSSSSSLSTSTRRGSGSRNTTCEWNVGCRRDTSEDDGLSGCGRNWRSCGVGGVEDAVLELVSKPQRTKGEMKEETYLLTTCITPLLTKTSVMTTCALFTKTFPPTASILTSPPPSVG